MSTLIRNNYGVLCVSDRTTPVDKDALEAARAICRTAASAGKIPAEYDDMEFSRKCRTPFGTRAVHEIYDIFGGEFIVCVRTTEGTKYGLKTLKKEYFHVKKWGNGIRVQAVNQKTVAKAAKNSKELGDVIAICVRNTKKLDLKCMQSTTGYKAVAIIDGEYFSIFSGEKYTLGQLKTEKVADYHKGGFYFYDDIESALTASVPTESKFYTAKRVVLECAVKGRRIRYGNKIASTFLTPHAVCACVI